MRDCNYDLQYFDPKAQKCLFCSECSACQVKNQFFCSKCAKCQKTCDIFILKKADHSAVIVSSPQIEFDLKYLQKNHLKKNISLKFIRLQKTVFEIKLNDSSNVTSTDIELELSAMSISWADCKMPPFLLGQVRLERPKQKIMDLSFQNFKQILQLIESLSILAYFKFNLVFIFIDFINKNKLLTYIYGLNPHKTTFFTDFNLFIISNNYQQSDLFFSWVLGLSDDILSREYAAIRIHSGFRINEQFLEEVELLDFTDLVVYSLILLNSGLLVVVKWFARKFSLNPRMHSQKQMAQR